MHRVLFSPHWHRVADLRPALRRDVAFARHVYRGRVWWLAHDRAGDRRHRFSPAAHFLIGQFDGKARVEDIWRSAAARLGDDAPTQDEVIALLHQLHRADLLDGASGADPEELMERERLDTLLARRRWMSAPLMMKVKLLDPGPLLAWVAPFARILWSVPGLILWLALFVAGLASVTLHWEEMSESLADRVLAPTSLLGLAVAYLLLKALHETAHALAVTAFGGRVHDVGVVFLLFVPMPYVDASGSIDLPERRRRIAVAAAGMMSDLAVAAAAALLWPLVEAGGARSFLRALMLVGGVGTVLFNGNPLLRFDGYFILCDLLGIPNLAQRAQRRLAHLGSRWLLGDETSRSPAAEPGETFWLTIYGPAAAAYRLLVAFAIALHLSTEYLLPGVLLALWTLALLVLLPAAKALSGLGRGRMIRDRPGRVVAGLGAAFSVVAALLFLLPIPRTTLADGIVSAPEATHVRVEADGILLRLLAVPGDRVERGTPLAELEDPTVDAQLRSLEAELEALRVRLRAAAFTDPVQAALLREEIEAVEASRRRTAERKGAQTIVAPGAGIFTPLPAGDRLGVFLPRGSVFGYVYEPDRLPVTAVVGQDAFGAIQHGIERIEVLGADGAGAGEGGLVRIVPGGQTRLPHRAFALDGGGSFALDPRFPAELRTLENVYELELAPVGRLAGDRIGRRVHLRFEHAPEPVATQMWRAARRLFLGRLEV
ncbi:MAG: HlyD family secretion protein [Siculibacillus sp.]|nr:HlyD family secretion protein [Siculibacillus sp.]